MSVQPLYSYLRGNNEAKLQIDMAKPAIIYIQPDKDFSSTGTNYTVLFYLPDLSEVSASCGQEAHLMWPKSVSTVSTLLCKPAGKQLQSFQAWGPMSSMASCVL